MTTHASTLPLARGRLSTTSIAELLVLALERRLSGSFVFQTPGSDRSALVVASGRVTKVRTAEPIDPLGRLLTDSGVIDAATLERTLRLAQERNDRLGDVLLQLDLVDHALLERTLREQLERRLCWLGRLPEESAYGFYVNVDFLKDSPECGVEPLSLIWRCIRDGRAVPPGQEAALGALGARPLRLRARAALERFDLAPQERECFESLRENPRSLAELSAHPGLDAASARRLIYALVITHQLELEPEPSVGAGPPGSERPPGARPTLVPPASASVTLAPPGSARSTLLPPPGSRSTLLPPPGSRSTLLPPPGSRPASGRPSTPHAAPPAPAAPASSAPPPPGSLRPSAAPERVEHALERASRLVRERARAEGAAEAAREMDAARELIEKKQFAEAEKLVRQACQLDPGNAEHLGLHAWLRMQCGDLAVPALAAQVLATLDRAVMKAPTSVSVRFQRAQVLKRLGRDEDAYKDFRFVARRAPDRLDAVREVRLHLMRTRNAQKQSGVFSKLFLR